MLEYRPTAYITSKTEGYKCDYKLAASLGTDFRLRQSYPDIRLILVLPCVSQADKWPPADAAVYQEIMGQANKIVYTSHEYTAGCMFKRNRHLVDHSSVCICYLEKSNGGTAYTVDYARKCGLKIINLAGK